MNLPVKKMQAVSLGHVKHPEKHNYLKNQIKKANQNKMSLLASMIDFSLLHTIWVPSNILLTVS